MDSHTNIDRSGWLAMIATTPTIAKFVPSYLPNYGIGYALMIAKVYSLDACHDSPRQSRHKWSQSGN